MSLKYEPSSEPLHISANLRSPPSGAYTSNVEGGPFCTCLSRVQNTKIVVLNPSFRALYGHLKFTA